MDPTTVFCPHLACPARGQIGQGTIGIHARQDKRFLCPVCRQTFSATTGPACDRLRTAVEAGTLATLRAELAEVWCRDEKGLR